MGVRLLDRTEGEMRVTDRKEPIETLRLWERSVLDDDMASQSFRIQLPLSSQQV